MDSAITATPLNHISPRARRPDSPRPAPSLASLLQNAGLRILPAAGGGRGPRFPPRPQGRPQGDRRDFELVVQDPGTRPPAAARGLDPPAPPLRASDFL